MKSDQHQTAYATLRFTSDDLDPQAVTEATGLTPTLSYRKGQRYSSGRRRREYVGRTGVWLLETKSLVDSIRLQDHLDYLSARLTEHSDRLGLIRSMVADLGYAADASCFWYGPAGAQEPKVPASFRSLIGQIGGEVLVDFHRDEESENAATRRAAAG